MKKILLFICLSLGFSLASSLSQAELSRSDIQKGLNLLFSGVELNQPVDFQKLTDSALDFKKNYDTVISQYQMKDLKIKKIDILTTKFQFSSAVQIPDAKSNTVHGYIYHPMVPIGCTTQFPATLFIHHVANEIESERMFSSLAAKMKKGVVMLIFLPDYGPRQEIPDALPFASDIHVFKEKLFQALVDVRVAGELLARQENVNPNQLQLGGLSLGGIVTAMSAGIDPFFHNYLIAMGGGDIAGILGMDKSKKTAPAIRKALSNIHWDINMSRQVLSSLDAITWAYQVKGKNITFVNSKDDELVDKDMSVLKLIQAYRENGNDVTYKEHIGSHVPDLKNLSLNAIAKAYSNVIGTILDFLGETQSATLSQCQIN